MITSYGTLHIEKKLETSGYIKNQVSKYSSVEIHSGFFAILGRGPRDSEIGKSSAVKPLIRKIVIVHNYVIFWQ